MKPFMLLAIISLFMMSCTKTTLDSGSISQSVSNDAFVENYSYTFSEDYRVSSPCTNEEVHVTGEAIIRGQHLWVDDRYRIRGTLQFKNMRGIGLTTGDEYTLKQNAHESFVLDEQLHNTATPEMTYNLKGRYTMRSSTTGATFVSEFTYWFKINLLTWETTSSSEVNSYCK
jgi:hypothetical protein